MVFYLDDFITCGAANLDECQLHLQILLDICKHLGIPIAEEKVEGPAACLVFLGLIIDMLKGELRLPLNKLIQLRDRIKEWLQKNAVQNANCCLWQGNFSMQLRSSGQGEVFYGGCLICALWSRSFITTSA